MRFRSELGYRFTLYSDGAAFRRESDDKILILPGYVLPTATPAYVIQWPGLVKWSDESEVPEEEVQILMQIALDTNSLLNGARVANTRAPIPGAAIIQEDY